MANTIFDCQETVVESKDTVQAVLSHLPTHPHTEAATGRDSATRAGEQGLQITALHILKKKLL